MARAFAITKMIRTSGLERAPFRTFVRSQPHTDNGRSAYSDAQPPLSQYPVV